MQKFNVKFKVMIDGFLPWASMHVRKNLFFSSICQI